MIEWEEHREDCCIVIPVYKDSLVLFEQTSLMQCVRVLGQKHDIYLVAPTDLDLSPYTSLFPGFKFKVKRLAKGFFKDIPSYNHLCKRWEFYDTFKDYRYMLIYQLDCWVFEDKLDYFMGLGYDYIGAPWIKVDQQLNKIVLDKCGNGGFSLRKIDKFVEVCKKHKDETEDETVPEDVFFSTNCAPELIISPIAVGCEFSFEVGPSLLFKVNKNRLPMGCHKPYLFEFKNFWRNYIKF